MEQKIPSDVVPAPYGRLFTMYDTFNYMQTSLLNDLLYTDKSIVLSAPTGSGKTVVFELAIVRMLMEDDHTPSTSNNYISPKAIYIAPIKALCNEKFDNWKARFDTVGINCTQLTGDTQMANLIAIRKAQIVISTPEKWDSLTRRWRDFEKLLPSVQLFIVDEVHLLNEDNRGPILEAIVARMKSSGVKRFLVASATIPNVEDLTNWIRSCNTNVVQYVFNEMQRPVPLEKHVLGINTKLKGFQFDMKLNYQLPDIIRKYADGKATLIFCNSRKSAEMAAINLGKASPIFQLNNHQKMYLNQLAQRLIDTKLKKLIENGIAYHHAGLQYADRNLIESSFREGFLMTLFSTSTLAMGINFPAHLVIIKSTETYMRSGYVEYPENMLLQMMGRAGRPQYDTKGVVVILTQNHKVKKYKNLMNGKAPIESHFHKHLTEHLNSEIALNSINNLEVAMDWIRSTYLFVRSVRNPTHYGFPANMSKDLVEHKLEELSFKQICILESAGLVTINYVNGLNVQTTPIGKLMAKHYLSFETMRTFRDLNGNETLQNVFDLIVKSKELSEFTLRVNEKSILNALNKAPIRFPIKGRIKKNEEKITCIMQAVLGNLEITAPSMVQESLKMFRIGERVSKCLLEYVRLCVQKKIYSNSENVWFKTVLNVFILAKCFHAKLWENSEYASKQLHGIGAVYSSLLFNAGKTTLKSIAQTDARTIEHILKKSAPFGDEVLKNLFTFPEYEIKFFRSSADFVEVQAKQVNENYVHKFGAIAVLIVGDSLNNLLLLAENFDEISMEYGFFQRKLKLQNAKDVEYIYGHVVHTNLVGVDAYASLEINAPKMKNTEKTKKTTKKQTKLCITHNDTQNNSDFLPENMFNAENNVDIDEKLKIFQFVKSKISNDEQRNDSTVEMIMDEDENQLQIATIKPLNDISLMNDTTELNISRANRIVQRKLTDFFAERKNTNFMVSKNTAIDLTKNTDGNESCENVKPASNQWYKNEQPIENSSLINRKTQVSKDSTESSIKITCIENNATITRQLTPNDAELQSTTKKQRNESNPVNKDPIKTICRENIAPIKRQLTPNDVELQSRTKKQRNESNPFIRMPYNTCATSLASFLGDNGIIQSTMPLFKNENTPKDKQIQRIPPRPTEKSIRSSCENNPYLRASYNKCSMSLASFPVEMQPITPLLEEENTSKENKEIQRLPQRPIDKCNNSSFENDTSLREPYNKCPMSLASFLGKISPIKPLKENRHKQQYYPLRLTENNNSENIKSKPKSTLKRALCDTSFKRNDYDRIQSISEPLDLSKNCYENEHCLALKTNNNANTLIDVSPTEEEFLLWYKVAMKFQRIPIQAMSLKNFRYVYNKVITKEKGIQKQTEKHSKTSNTHELKVTKTLNERKNGISLKPTLEISGSSMETCHSISSESLFKLQLFVDDQNSSNNKLRRAAVNMINKNIMKRVLNAKSKFSTEAENMDLEEELTNALKDLEDELSPSEN